MKRINITLCGILLFAFTALAQESQVGKNWFISLGAGPNLLEGEQDREFMQGRIRVSGEFSLGKWFNPFIGARIQLSGGSLRGFNTFDAPRGGIYTKDGFHPNRNNLAIVGQSSKGFGDGFYQDFNYGMFDVDVMANLTNLFRGYATKASVVEVLPHVGLGLINAMESPTNPATLDLAYVAGIRFNFNISQSVAFYINPQATMTDDAFDGFTGGRSTDVFVSVLCGLQFTFNRNFTSVNCVSREELDYINQRINENRSMIDDNRTLIGNHQTIVERQQTLMNQLNGRVTDLEARPATIVNNNTGKQYLPEYVRFAMNSSAIPATERNKIEEAINYLNANEEAKLLLIGYADRETGNPSSNMTLSKNRVQAIAAELKNQGIAEDRLVLQWKGDQEQPFTQNEWNRVVILVAR